MLFMVGFVFVSHWFRKWRERCLPITQQSNAKPKETLLDWKLLNILYTYSTAGPGCSKAGTSFAKRVVDSSMGMAI